MKKLLVFVILMMLAPLVAGLYGALHDQISYTVAPEYYTKFKFIQFHLTDSPWPDRARAAIVGFRASWWMGLPIGAVVGFAGLIQRDANAMLRASLHAFVVAIAVTLLVGLLGLAQGFLATRGAIHRADYAGWFLPSDLTDLRRFVCAGTMHNASYVGGLVGLVAACVYQLVWRWKSP